jgi:hypothetical protein
MFRGLVLNQDGSTNLEAFATLWPHLRVMARCTPADKYTLVQVSWADKYTLNPKPRAGELGRQVHPKP